MFNMLKWTRDNFRIITEAFLWINLFACICGGFLLGNQLEKMGILPSGMIIGLFLGFFIGLVTNTIYGGFVSTVLNIDENLQKIHDHLLGSLPQNTEEKSQENKSSAPKKVEDSRD